MTSGSVWIGIDLGTSNSVAAVWTGSGALTIKDHYCDSNHTPSVVAFTNKGERLVGHVARRQQRLNPANTVHSIKQIIGRQFSDPVVARAKQHWPFRVVRGSDGTCRVSVSPSGRQTQLRLETISAAVLSRLVENAEKKLAAKVGGAVITVPASFGNAQRVATENAAAIAGLKVLKLMCEPSAAAYVYSATLLDGAPRPRNMLVFDLGGGTLDLAVLHVPASNSGITDDDMHVMAVDADLALGGDTFTSRLVEYCLMQLPITSGLHGSMFETPTVLSALYQESEEVKKTLTQCHSCTCNIVASGKTAQVDITRDKFEALCERDFQRVHGPLERVLAQAGLQRHDVNRVLLVGGSTRIPAIRNILSNFFGDRVELNYQVDPDEAVAHGAAIEAARLADILQLDVPPDERPQIIRSNSHNPEMDPEHVVMMQNMRDVIGPNSRNAAHSNMSMPVRGKPRSFAKLPKLARNFDVLPHTLSVVCGKGACWQMLMANSPYPIQHKQRFPKQWVDQDTIVISVVEGGSLHAVENELLGRFEVSGLVELPSGIDVVFSINESGITEVMASPVDDPRRHHKITVTTVNPHLEKEVINWLRPGPKEAPAEDPEVLQQQEAARKQLQQLQQEALDLVKDPEKSSETVAHVQRVLREIEDMLRTKLFPNEDTLSSLRYRIDKEPVVPTYSFIGNVRG